MTKFEQAVRQIAAQQGRHPDDVMAEMLQQQMQQTPRQLPPNDPHTEVVPANQGPQRFPMPGRFAGVPAPRDESEAEVIARYLQAESGPDGVFGEGGMTGGGIFGADPVATQGHDPGAHQRSQSHALAALAGAMAHQQRQAPVQYAQPAYPPRMPPQPPQMPPQQQTVRMIERTVVYEGPAPGGHGQPHPGQLPPPWWPYR